MGSFHPQKGKLNFLNTCKRKWNIFWHMVFKKWPSLLRFFFYFINCLGADWCSLFKWQKLALLCWPSSSCPQAHAKEGVVFPAVPASKVRSAKSQRNFLQLIKVTWGQDLTNKPRIPPLKIMSGICGCDAV